MKIKKTLFSTEIEITTTEIGDIYSNISPKYGLFEWLINFIKKL